ncbi:universal stress protein [Undibacterium pigrum]|uniref:Universal stress protein family protein n=1 Tax=Undibacterium pigrum TaxID=401470 RepID=A0A318JBK6_9BURK|nr:universal stress protein [Undibacterium pigrum]PXX46948.1 hypothetical protein DFR42_101524 [Undibacterium pigrum]
MNLNQKIIAWVDQSAFAANIADYATWAAIRLDAPLEFVHVTGPYSGQEIFSRRSHVVDIGTTESTANTGSAIQYSVAVESSAQPDESALGFQSSVSFGDRTAKFYHLAGELGERVIEYDIVTRLHIFGRQGQSSGNLGSNVRRCVRMLHKPVLVVNSAFRPPKRAMIVFDRGTISSRAVQLIASSPLFKNIAIHLLVCGDTNQQSLRALNWATNCLENAGHEVSAAFHQGDVRTQLPKMIELHSIDLLVLAAYPYSPLRSILLGHATTDFLRATTIPALLLRQLVDD